MLELLTAIQLLCDASACTYDTTAKIPTVTLMDCSLWKYEEISHLALKDRVVLIVKRVPCFET